MTYYDLYGFEVEHLDDAKRILEDVLEVRFNTHDSLYFGIYYMSEGIMGDKISIKSNSDPEENEYLEPDFPNIDCLIYVDNASPEVAKRYEEKLLKIDKLQLLERYIEWKEKNAGLKESSQGQL